MKNFIVTLLCLAFATVGYRLFYPTKIIGIHYKKKHTVSLIVNYFPWTTQGKISWWEKHRDDIFKKLKINEDVYSIYIYNTNYKKDSGSDHDSDLLCFEEMNTEVNCVSKENQPLVIHHYRDGHTEYTTESIFRRFY